MEVEEEHRTVQPMTGNIEQAIHTVDTDRYNVGSPWCTSSIDGFHYTVNQHVCFPSSSQPANL